MFAFRLAIVLVAPACLILGKASELYWGWILLSLSVAIGYRLLNRKYLKRPSDPKESHALHFRFSIRTLLFCMLVVSWFLFAYLRTEYRDLLAWRSTIAISIVFTLFAIGIYALVLATRSCSFFWMISIRIASCFLLVLVIPLVWSDDLLPAFLDDFSPWPPVTSAQWLAMFSTSDRIRLLWFFVGGLFYFLWILIPNPTCWSQTSRRWRVVTSAILLIVVTFPAWVGSNIMLPIKRDAARHESNAFHEWASLGHQCEKSTFSKALATYSEWEKVSADEQQVVLKENAPLLAAIRETLQRPIWIPLTYTIEDIDTSTAGAFRSSSRLAIAHGTSQLNARSDEAVDSILVVAKMGSLLQRGGLMIHSLIGVAISSQAIDWFKIHMTSLSPKDRSRIVTDLKRWMDDMESADVIRRMDVAWSSSVYWVFHVRSIIDRTLGVSRDIHGFESAVDRHLTEWRMLIIELLLENHRDETGSYPADYESLLLADWPEVAHDPFASNQNFKYRTTNEGFLLYSVGDNGIDDGGDFPPRPDEFIGLDLSLARRLIVPAPDAIQ